MPFTHYPKQSNNLLVAWVYPAPEDKPNFLSYPRFSSVNLLIAPLPAGETVRFYHEAQNFTRFFGSFASDQPLELVCSFSNDEVAPDGEYVSDKNLKDLWYDAESLRQQYDPKKPKLNNGGKFFTTIYGRWICVELTNKGVAATEFLRAYVRCSVF